MKLVSVKILCCPVYYCLVAIASWTIVSTISDDGFCVELQPQKDQFKGNVVSPIGDIQVGLLAENCGPFDL